MRRLLIPWLFSAVLLAPLAAWAQVDNTLSPSTYEQLNDIQTLLADEDWPQAREQLDELLQELTPGFGKALALQLSGQYWLSRDDNAKAIQEFEQALALDAFAPSQEAGMATNVAQLYLAQQQYDGAVSTLKKRLPKLLTAEQNERQKTGKDTRWVQPMAMITLATAYQLQQNYQPSIGWIQQAIERQRQAGKAAQENWWRMLMVAQYRQNLWSDAIKTLDVLLSLAPEKESYWQQQAAIYQQLGQEQKALTVLETAYAGGYLQQSQSQLLLVQMLINQGLPERAGRILARAIEQGNIEKTERQWRLLALAWQQGRQRQQAILALQHASKAMDDGELLYRAALLAMQDNDYGSVISNAQMALKKTVSDKTRAQLLLLAGNAAFQSGQTDTASGLFRQALTLPATAATAKQWLEYIDSLDEFDIEPGSFAAVK